MATQEVVHSVLSLIDTAGLPHPSGPLLASFVKDAVDPVMAARYVQSEITASGAPTLVSDWTYVVESITQNGCPPPPPNSAARHDIARRDGNRCSVTGKPGRFWDPLVVKPIVSIPSGWVTDKPRIFNMLGAFFGHTYRDWWLSYTEHPECTSSYANHWLVRESAHQAFARGLVCLQRSQPSLLEYTVEYPLLEPEDAIEVEGSYPLLGDHSRSGIEKVNLHFVGTHARLCRSIRFVEIAKSLASEAQSQPPISSKTFQAQPPSTTKPQPPHCKTFSPTSCASSVFLTTWLIFPSRFRIAIYNLLRKLGTFLYGPSSHPTVTRLPFNLYLKRQTESALSHNEFNALSLLNRHTPIPVPRPLDLAHKPADPSDPFSLPEFYLLTTRIPGIPLYRCQHVLSDTNLKEISLQMSEYLVQLRTIPRPPTQHANEMSNTLGAACRDPRIRGEEPVGPFPDETSFSEMLRFPDDPARRGHSVVFTHADLNPRNILVERDGHKGWRVTGIVDWENAGWYPEYWECTKAFFEGFRWTRRYNDMVRGWFGRFGGYEKEREVERRAWEMGDGI